MCKSVKHCRSSAASGQQPSKMVQTLTKKMKNMKIKFDRVAYRKAYDAVYFKKKVACPRCGQLNVKHMLRRHMKTKKCRNFAGII